MGQAVHESQFLDGLGRQHKGIKIRQAHGAVETVDRKGDRQPGVDQLFHVGGIVRIEIHPRHQFAPRRARLDLDAESRGGFQRVDDMKIMRPGFREILPGMGGGV
jgi:hypothetical protein